jgi:DedD protein
MRGAKAQVARGSKLGFKPYTEKVKTSRGDRIRVRVGPYLTKKQATQARARLRAAGIDTALIAP